MLVARRSFTTRCDGELVEIRAGVSRVSTTHELARDGRGAWAPIRDRRAMRTSTRARRPANDSRRLALECRTASFGRRIPVGRRSGRIREWPRCLNRNSGTCRLTRSTSSGIILRLRRHEKGVQVFRRLRFSCVVVVAFAVYASVASAAVAPPRAHPYGHSYAQWAGKWTRWALEMPAASSPFVGTAGCGEHQHGPMFFLPIQFGPGASFNCRVRVGHSLLFSPMGSICSPATGDGSTLAELRSCARSIFPSVTRVTVRIDGRPLDHARRWRFVSPVVPVMLPAGNIAGAPAGPTTAITGGWYYIVRPLSPGCHVIRTSATLIPPFGPATVQFQYHIKVTRP